MVILISRYLKLLFIISYLMFFSVHAMENCEIDKQFSEFNDFNLLEQIPPELLLNIIKMIPVNDSGSDYLRKYYKFLYKKIHKEFAEYDMNKLWNKLILISNNLQELEQRIEDKYRSLDNSFPNYNVLNETFTNVIIKQYKILLEISENMFFSLQRNIDKKNSLEFDKIISLFNISDLLVNNKREDLYNLKHCLLVIRDVRNDLIFEVFKKVVYRVKKRGKFIFFCLCMAFFIDLIFPTILKNAWAYGSNLLTVFTIVIFMYINLMSYMMLKYHFIKPIYKKVLNKIDILLYDLEKNINELSENKI